jgi:hypothetical protein
MMRGLRWIATGAFIVSGFAFAAPALAQRPDIVRCESQNDRVRACPVQGASDVRLYQQLSDSRCRAGRDWSFDGREIIVRNGCRAEFAVQYSGFGNGFGQNGRVIVCESLRGRPTICPAPNARNVYIGQQLSDSRCRNGRDWNFNGQEIEVRNGCRAEFTVVYRGPGGGGGGGFGGGNGGGFGGGFGGGYGGTVLCESRNGRTQRCDARGARQVQITRQLSNDSCRRGQDWDFDGRAITVRYGCRGEFRLIN